MRKCNAMRKLRSIKYLHIERKWWYSGDKINCSSRIEKVENMDLHLYKPLGGLQLAH